jgi:hypothetical protein
MDHEGYWATTPIGKLHHPLGQEHQATACFEID